MHRTLAPASCLGNLFPPRPQAEPGGPHLMIQAGYPPTMVQAIVGHASMTTTLDLYGHLYPGDMDRYSGRLGEAAEAADPAIIRPDDEDTDPGGEASAR